MQGGGQCKKVAAPHTQLHTTEALYPAALWKPCTLLPHTNPAARPRRWRRGLPALLAWCRPSDRLHAALLPHTLDAACALLQQCGRTTGASTGAVVCGLLRAGPRRCRMTLQRQGPLTLAYGCHDSMDFPGFLYLLRSRARARAAARRWAAWRAARRPSCASSATSSSARRARRVTVAKKVPFGR